MDAQTITVLALFGLGVAGLVAWVLRELETALGWLSQPAGAAPTHLEPQDAVQAQQELLSR